MLSIVNLPVVYGLIGFIAGIGLMILFNFWVIKSEKSRFKRTANRYIMSDRTQLFTGQKIKKLKDEGLCAETDAEILA